MGSNFGFAIISSMSLLNALCLSFLTGKKKSQVLLLLLWLVTHSHNERKDI